MRGRNSARGRRRRLGESKQKPRYPCLVHEGGPRREDGRGRGPDPGSSKEMRQRVLVLGVTPSKSLEHGGGEVEKVGLVERATEGVAELRTAEVERACAGEIAELEVPKQRRGEMQRVAAQLRRARGVAAAVPLKQGAPGHVLVHTDVETGAGTRRACEGAKPTAGKHQ